ncbi:MAG: hypothetical protein LBK27_08420 [Treponema sp.]|nr:hypothetical protein [Treponema sp.]
MSLLISVFLFAGIAVLAFTGLFDLVETRFYNPSITKSLGQEVSRDSEVVEDFLAGLQTRFAETLGEAAVRRSVLPNQSAEDIFERTRIYGTLLESLGGLQSVRFVDAGGVRIHFSTATRDIQSQDRLSVAYRNYNEDPASLPYDRVEVPAQGEVKFTLDQEGDRIILSFPFYDTFEVYRGTALFSVSVRAVAERLVSENRIKVGDDVSIVSNPQGVVSGLPGTTRLNIISRVSSIWNDGLLGLTPLDSAASETTLALISAKTGQGIFVGRLVNENLFAFPQSMKMILLVSIFLTVYLAIFLAFNLRQDTMTVIQNRLKGLQISLIEQYYERKGDVDWTHWIRELEQRREDIRAEVKRGVRTGQGRRAEEDIDSLIDKSWDELLAVIGGRRSDSSGIDEEKLQSILNRVLQALPAGAAVPGLPASTYPLPAAVQEPPVTEKAEEAVELAEELEELEEAEPVEELADAEDAAPVEAMEPEELEELADAEDAAPIEELADTEDAAPIEELADAEDTAPVEAMEPEDLPGAESFIDLADQTVDDIINAAAFDEEPAELEELEELDEADSFDGGVAAKPAAAAPSGPPKATAADMASRIEFSGPADTDETGEPALLDVDLEIVSPFATLLSNVSILEEEEPDDDEGDAPPDGYSADDRLTETEPLTGSTEFAEDTEAKKKICPVI